MKEDKKYTVPNWVGDIMIDAIGALELRNQYLNQRFGYKRALKASKEYMRLRFKYWNIVKREYPELKDVACDTLDHTGYTVVIKQKESDNAE